MIAWFPTKENEMFSEKKNPDLSVSTYSDLPNISIQSKDKRKKTPLNNETLGHSDTEIIT
jgi:hypothetical protein